MKKIVTSLLSIALCIAMCVPITAQALSPATAQADTSNKRQARLAAEIGGAVAKYAFGRAYAELSSWAISNDVPFIGGIAKLMLSPSQRASLTQSAQVTQILNTVGNISDSIELLYKQNEDLSEQLKKLDQKTDLYYATSLLNDATQAMNEVADDYDDAWDDYEKLNKAVAALDEANTKLKAASDPDEIAKLEKEAELADAEVQSRLADFIDGISEGGGLSFSSDIGSLKKKIYNASSPTSSYLGALELYLRETELFEHQITDQMIAAMENCGYTLYRIFILYSEYYTYLREYTDDKNKDDPDAENPYDDYDEDRFLSLRDELDEYFDSTAIASGIADYMVTEPMSDDELNDYKELDGDFTAPECIDTTVTVNGVSYPCYKVRSNADMQYYIILKQYVAKEQLVQTVSSGYFTAENVTLCRPAFVLDHEYTDDGSWRLISESELPSFITGAPSSVLSYLRTTGGLESLSQSTANILLRDNTCVGESGSDYIWELKAVDTSASGSSGTVTLKTGDIKNGSVGSAAIAIYRFTDFNAKFTGNTFQPIDRSEIENQIISVEAGQTLDLTKLTVDVSNVTVRVVGSCKIISNPQITLKNSRITVFGAVTVTFENVNITAKKGDLAAIVISDKGATLNFNGTDSISGTATGSDSAADYYANYTPGNPIGASHGIYAADNSLIMVYGSASFSGADGGAGICAVGLLLLIGDDGSKIIANGSRSSTKKDKYFPLTVGAGIGGSISTSIDYITVVHYINGTALSVQYYKLRTDKTTEYVGSNANIQITAPDLEACGADIGNINASVGSAAGSLIYFPDVKSDLEDIVLSSDDIGGAAINSTGYDIRSGIISKSTVALKRQKISSKITTKGDDNSYKPEVYSFKVFTHGSDGVTADGISFMLDGEAGTSDWIVASECGTEKGYWTGSFVVDNVGKIKALKVKSNKDGDKWFGGEITIEAQLGGQSTTFYAGKYISTSGTWLYTWDPVYKVTIETGTEDDSGTDADIDFQLVTSGGKGWEFQLDSIHWEDDAFEKGDVATFYISSLYDYDCIGFYLGSDCSGKGPQWKVDRVTVEKVNGKNNVGDSFTVNPGYWFRTEQNVFFGRNSQKTGAFYIEVKTSDKSSAGTDSNIYLTVNGSKDSTGEVELDVMAEDGDNFERGDLDAMCIGFDKQAIGEIQSITIRKDDAGSGADWHLEYIIIQEIVAKGQTPQTYKFTWNDWIEDETVTLTNRTSIDARRNDVKFDRELLSGLSVNDDGGYTLTVDREITLSESAFELIAENSAILTVVMENNEKPLYEVIFDGSRFDSWHHVTLGKGYAFADGKALFDFLQRADLPNGTKIRLHAENLGFIDGSYRLYSRDEADKLTLLENAVITDGVIEFYAQTVKELMILDRQNFWVTTPSFAGYVSGEKPSQPVAEALHGSFTVRYTGTAADGTKWNSNDAPTKAGKYTAVFTVEEADSYEGLTYSLSFEVTAAENKAEPDEPKQPSDSLDPVIPVEPVSPVKPVDTDKPVSPVVPDDSGKPDSTLEPDSTFESDAFDEPEASDEATDSPDSTEPVESTANDATASPTESSDSDSASDQVGEKATSLTWLYVVIAAVVILGVGFVTVRVAVKKKKA